MTDDRHLQVLYDPLSYLVGWQHVAAELAGHERARLNEVLLRQHALPPFQPSPPHQARWVQRLLQAWEAIPAAAYLMACSLWREELVATRLYTQLEPQVHAFLQFEFGRRPMGGGPPPSSRQALVTFGGACIPVLMPELPSWLARRLALRFDALPEHMPAPPPAHSDSIRFSMALAHAQKDPRFCRSVCP